MLLWITEVSESQESPLQIVDRNVEALSFLGEAGALGRHVVIASRDRLRVLARDDRISRRARAYYEWMADAVTQYGGLSAAVECVLVSAQCHAPIQVGEIWTVPLSLFNDPDRLLSAEMICENETDFDVLVAFGRSYLRRSFPGFSLALRSRPGGGDTTAQVLRSALREPNPPTLCVVDSDRERLGGALGQTARRCKAEVESHWRVRLHILECRELENIVPATVTIGLFAQEGRDATLVRQFELVPDDLSRYVCVKSGETLCRFHQLTDAHGHLAEVRAALVETDRTHPAFRGCGTACREINCRVVPALGGDFLARLATWLSTNWNRIPLSDEWHPQLTEAVNRVVSAGLALGRRV